MRDPFTIYHNGLPKYRINERLVGTRNCFHNLKKIVQMHETKLDIYDAIKSEECPVVLKRYTNDLTLCEYELQKLWGFMEDPTFHHFWETPTCGCPEMDNLSRLGTQHKVTNINCRLHGSRIKTDIHR